MAGEERTSYLVKYTPKNMLCQCLVPEKCKVSNTLHFSKIWSKVTHTYYFNKSQNIVIIYSYKTKWQ